MALVVGLEHFGSQHVATAVAGARVGVDVQLHLAENPRGRSVAHRTSHLRSAPMNLGLTDDQQFFRETTRKFLEQEAPLTTVRALAEDPDGFDRAWWAEVPSSAGRRSSCPRTTAAAASPVRASSTWRSWPRRWDASSRRDRSCPSTSWPTPSPRRHGRAAGRGAPGHRRRGDRRRVVHRRSPRAAGTRTASRSARVRDPGTACVLDGVSTPVEYARAGRPTARDRAHRRRRSRSAWCRRRRRASHRADRLASTWCGASPRSYFDDVQVPADRIVGEVGGAAAAVERQLHSPIALQSAESGRRPRPGVRVHPRVALATAARSAGRWRPTRRSSTASPT